MSSQGREQMHDELLVALYEARKRVSALEGALSHYEALQGSGVESERTMGAQFFADSSDSLMQYIGLVETDDDISNFIGREGHEDSRPRLGPDAPFEVQPARDAPLHPLVSRLADGHPDDTLSISFTGRQASSEDQTDFSTEEGEESAACADAPFPDPAENMTLPDEGLLHDYEGSHITFVPAGDETAPVAARTPSALEPGRNEDCLRSCLVLQLCNEGVWDWDLPSGELYCSSRWREIVGGDMRRRGESPLDTFARYIHPDDQEPLRSRFDSLLSGAAKLLSMELRFRRAENSWGWGVLLAAGISYNGEVRRIIAVLRDISEQRNIEKALRVGGELFRSLTGGSPDVVSCFDRQGRFLSVSPNFSRYCAALPEHVAGKHLQDFDITGEIAHFEENLRRVFEAGIPFQEEMRFVSPLTGEFIADCRFQPEFGEDGNVASVAVVLRDMTASRRMKENYNALLSAMDDGFALFEYNMSHRQEPSAYSADEFSLMAMNPSFGRFFSLKASQAVGRRLDVLMDEAARPFAECLRLALTENRQVKKIVRVAGRSLALTVYSPEKGRAVCLVREQAHERQENWNTPDESFFAAVHALARLDEASEEEAARFILEQATRMTGSGFGYLYMECNDEDGACRLYWSPQVAESAAGEAAPPDARAVPLFRELDRLTPDMAELANDAGERAAVIFGSTFAVRRYMLAPVSDEGRTVCIVAVANKDREYESAELRQLTLFLGDMWSRLRHRRAMLAAARAKEEAEAEASAKNDILAAISHSLRTPLNGILGMLQALQQSPLSEIQREWILTANYSGLGLLRSISDLLDFSRMEEGALELGARLFDFPATVRSALAMFAHQAERKNIRFSLKMDPAIPDALIGDEVRLRQIVTNMVDSAFTLTARGGIRVECALLPRRKAGKLHLYLEVLDTGTGMPLNALEDISRAFARKAGTRPYTGTAIGLAVACNLVKLMGGTCEVDSIVGKGSTVHCSLPFDEPRQTLVSPDSSLDEPAAALDILVAGDDPSNQFTLRTMLHQAGHTSVCVGNGRQALEALMLRSFDCLITDMQMQVMDGAELIGRIRSGNTSGVEPGSNIRSLLGMDGATGNGYLAAGNDIPIVALLPRAMAAERERVLGLGVDYCLARPVFAADLASVLGHIGKLLSTYKKPER